MITIFTGLYDFNLYKRFLREIYIREDTINLHEKLLSGTQEGVGEEGRKKVRITSKEKQYKQEHVDKADFEATNQEEHEERNKQVNF